MCFLETLSDSCTDALLLINDKSCSLYSVIPVNWHGTGNGLWILQQTKIISFTDIDFYSFNFFPNQMCSCASLLSKIYVKMSCSEMFCKNLQTLDVSWTAFNKECWMLLQVPARAVLAMFQSVAKCSRPQASLSVCTCSRYIDAHAWRISKGKRVDKSMIIGVYFLFFSISVCKV